MTREAVIACTCGVVVSGSEELEPDGVCVVCAGSGHEPACGCAECWGYHELTGGGEPPTVALGRLLERR